MYLFLEKLLKLVKQLFLKTEEPKQKPLEVIQVEVKSTVVELKPEKKVVKVPRNRRKKKVT